MDADAGGWQGPATHSPHQAHRAANGGTRVAEVHHHPIAEDLPEPAVEAARDRLDRFGELPRQTGGLLVAGLLGELRIAADVHERDRGKRARPRKAVLLELLLHCLDDLLERRLVNEPRVEELD